MCAINPTHKKRFIIDVYTASKTMTREQFDEIAITILLLMEQRLNETKLRYHVKESKEQAE